ncbi:hypothetical protein GFO_0310 [Christiangramia forsetii KT0803]|uniref:Uncharacterized protein n=1 Tax=Christiangramia forsetii (strain DSM 17595 / CGMCC 1.15422 / KT0803) TaxID=411154 RepID=A0LY51_CHRFK|nr:hypothetical protein GFO_0310 [Christiangramia forsetii KT0803]
MSLKLGFDECVVESFLKQILNQIFLFPKFKGFS